MKNYELDGLEEAVLFYAWCRDVCTYVVFVSKHASIMTDSCKMFHASSFKSGVNVKICFEI